MSATRLEPPISAVAAPFWEATRRRELVLQWCEGCDKPIHYPRALCPFCNSDALEFRAVSGSGTVYARTVVHRPGNPTMAERVPYVVALIQLDEGARLMSNVVGCEPHDVHVGMQVKTTWEELSDGRALPLFEPSDAVAKGEDI